MKGGRRGNGEELSLPGIAGKLRSTRLIGASISKERWINVTPEMAKKWLEDRHRNRSIHDRAVREYFNEMAEGRWRPELPTAQPIVRDSEGRLVNGQHRLTALVALGRPMMMRVATLDPGADIEVLRVAEATVRPQSAADLVSALDGKTHATTRAAFAKMWMALERDVRVSERVSIAVQLKAIRQNNELFDDVVEMCRSAKTRHLCNASFGGVWLWASTGKHGIPNEFRDFAASYIAGTGLEAGNPIHLLREHTLGSNFRSHDRASIIKRVCNAFEAHITGERNKRLGMSSQGFEALANRIGKKACAWVVNGKIG